MRILEVVLWKMVTGKFRDWQSHIQSGKYHLPFFLSLELKNILRKLMTLDPRERKTLKLIMRYLWLNMGQKEELGPYSRPMIT